MVIPVMVLVQHPESRHGKESPRRPWSTYGTGFFWRCFFFFAAFGFFTKMIMLLQAPVFPRGLLSRI